MVKSLEPAWLHATFTNETASGWQQVNFATPVAINANTTYVASYHTTVGHYSLNANYFAGGGVDNGQLHALANSVSANGVYRYGASNLFPNQTWNASNYWVDVVFQPNCRALSGRASTFRLQHRLARILSPLLSRLDQFVHIL